MANVEKYEQKDILGYRGEKVVCQMCREENDKILWKVLYEIKTKPGARVSPKEEEKILSIIQQHIMNFPEHNVAIVRMKA